MPLEPVPNLDATLNGWTHWAMSLWWKHGPPRAELHVAYTVDRMTRWGRRDMTRATELERRVVEHLIDLGNRMRVDVVGLNYDRIHHTTLFDGNYSPS